DLGFFCMQKIRNRLNEYEPGQLRQRFKIAVIVVSVALALLVLRMWHLQVIKGEELRQRSENNSVRLRKIKPMRGLIMDSERRVLVDNQPSFDLVFIPNRARDIGNVIEKIKALYAERSLALPPILSFPGRLKPFVPVLLERNISREKLAVVETHAFDLPGVVVEVTPIRKYLNGEMTAQLIGFTGEVSREDLERDMSGRYAAGDITGKFGIEKFLDSHLRGRSGAEQVEVNVAGKTVRSLGKIPATTGDNVVLTIDSALQETAWKALGDRAGALVALDPRSGDVLALVSSPSFNPNLFNGGISFDDWESLSNDPRHPMENRSISGQYPPASTYKSVIAAAALEEGLITPETSFFCNGAFELGDRKFRCWQEKGHGHVKLHRALVESCDVYFYNLGKMLGVDRIAFYARAFGLGAPLGVDLSREKGGLIPTKQWKLDRLKEPWQMGETLSISIGQGFNLVTPLQLANIYAALANGGTFYRPRLVKQLESSDGRVVKEYGPEKQAALPVRPENIRIINRALWGAVNERGGTGYALKRKGEDVAGKTGTAQVVGLPQDEKGRKTKRVSAAFRDHALFACFAPYANPEIAVAVILENAGHGGTAAAPVARKVIDAYFAGKKTDQPPAKFVKVGSREKLEP
ncbi:MAG: penicillin-binding protein 2, partial [Proteobacteria bacterium]|nr:penicillin-binding protein 2 [Pseudomonadota bacterium]MBU2262136.1 penicillin-binding protein 2 [Pseudomonadota bacterium]